MSELDKRYKNTGEVGIESKEGERRRLSSHNVGTRSPSLEYVCILNSEGIDKAFDILFEEVIRRINQNNSCNQQN